MRAVFLLLVLLGGWLAAAPGGALAAGAGDERVQAAGGADDAAAVLRARGGELLRVFETRKTATFPPGTIPLFAPPSSLLISGQQVAAATKSSKPADIAHRFQVVARPISPRAPPATRL